MEISQLKIDKKNGTCLYSDEKHIYWDEKDEVKYVSVTTLIHKFTQEFDEEFWSAYKALEAIMAEGFSRVKSSLLKSKKFNIKLIDKLEIDKLEFETKRQEIKNAWETNKNKACERGTAIHLGKELNFYEGKEHEIKHFGLGGKFTCERNYYELDLEKGVYPEYLVSRKSDDELLRVAGQIDLLIKDGNDIYIIDYKTNKKLDEKSYFDPATKKHQMMKYPLNNVMDCNMLHYTLQLSTYAYLLKLINPEFNVKRLMIIHYDHDGNEKHYELKYMEKEVEIMLKFYKKQIMLDRKKELRKPIEY